MVITFDARFQNISRRCAPLLGKRILEMQSSDMNPRSSSNHGSNGIQLRTRSADETNDCQLNRHKRQKQELAYTAATIDQALQEAGRPATDSKAQRRERALPSGSVDLSCVKVVSASDYDCSSKASGTTTGCNSTENEENENDLYYKAFYTNYSSLLQSTRQYYNSVSFSESKFTNEENEKKSETSCSTEGLSSWTPSYSKHDLKDNKDIDNDNRSDQSSLVAEGSISDFLSCGSNSPPLSQEVGNKNDSEVAYAVVG